MGLHICTFALAHRRHQTGIGGKVSEDMLSAAGLLYYKTWTRILGASHLLFRMFLKSKPKDGAATAGDT